MLRMAASADTTDIVASPDANEPFRFDPHAGGDERESTLGGSLVSSVLCQKSCTMPCRLLQPFARDRRVMLQKFCKSDPRINRVKQKWVMMFPIEQDKSSLAWERRNKHDPKEG